MPHKKTDIHIISKTPKEKPSTRRNTKPNKNKNIKFILKIAPAETITPKAAEFTEYNERIITIARKQNQI